MRLEVFFTKESGNDVSVKGRKGTSSLTVTFGGVHTRPLCCGRPPATAACAAELGPELAPCSQAVPSLPPCGQWGPQGPLAHTCLFLAGVPARLPTGRHALEDGDREGGISVPICSQHTGQGREVPAVWVLGSLWGRGHQPETSPLLRPLLALLTCPATFPASPPAPGRGCAGARGARKKQ